MGAEIDRLELQVETQATKANNQLDKLVGKLDSLSNSLSHINSSGLTGLSNGVAKFAQASAQLSNVKTADFTRLIKNISSLSSVNTQQIFSAASSIMTLSNAINMLGGASGNSSQVIDIANGIGRLGSASVQKAIANLPALGKAMNNLMTTLSKAPTVNSNIIQMTNSLATLASQGLKVGTAGTSLARSVNGVGTAMSATAKKAHGLSSVLGSIYQKYFWLIRGTNKLWDSIENSMNYVEVLNYFDSAFGQVAESAVSQWEDAGYSSADAYYNSFSNRAKELTSRMTGFTVNDNGTLTATGDASLGINPSQLMNYQATFAQMSSSMGVISESSLLLSQALTEIGADLASVKNMDFDKVWKDMASGLAGMSRTLDKYGVNIRNVNLQQKLFDLGINENITNLNQNDKALLRAIILLDSTRYAWGDLADTLNQPANQLRLLESNFNNLSRTIGNLFLPVVSRVLPYVNGLVIGLQRLFTWIGNLLGIDLSGITSAVGDSAVDIGDLIGDTDDLTGSLGEAGNAAKKLKSNLQGFDELNVITTQENSGISGSVSGLPSGLLDEAFEKSFAEYQKVWDEAFANIENRANNFADKVDEFFKPIRDIIEDFAIGDFFKAGEDTSKLISSIFDFFTDAIKKVDWHKLGSNIGEFLKGIRWLDVFESIKETVVTALEGAATVWFASLKEAPFETALITAIALWKFTKFGKNVGSLISNAIPSSYKKELSIKIVAVAIAWEVGFDIGKELGKVLFPEDVEWYEDFTWFGEGGFFETLLDIESVIGGIIEMSKDGRSIMYALISLIEKYNGKLLTGQDVMKYISDFLAKIHDGTLENIQAWINIGKNIIDGIIEGVKEKLQETTVLWSQIFTWMFNGICDVFGIHSPARNMEPIGENILLGIVNGFSEAISCFTDAVNDFFEDSVNPWFSKETWNLSGIEEGLSEAFQSAVDSARVILQPLVDFANSIFGTVNDIGGMQISGNALSGKKIKVPAFEIGGFPEDGLFMANHNELVGQFSNGKTAVANSYQIQDGIEEAAYRGMTRALNENKGRGTTIHIEGDTKRMFRAWVEEYTNEAERLQDNPIPIF